MPELRKDPIIARWIIVNVERARRPRENIPGTVASNKGKCPFCLGNEKSTPPEVYAIRDSGYNPNAPDWDVRVVPNKSPLLRIEGEIQPQARGLFEVMNGVGANEIIIESPQHIHFFHDLSEKQIFNIVACWMQRIKDLEKDPRFRYVLIFKNHGIAAGARHIAHSHSQLIATPIIPRRVEEEVSGARKYYQEHDRCIFCDMIKQEVEPKSRIVHEDEHFVLMAPFASRFPFELCILPKKHACDFSAMTKPEQMGFARVMRLAALKIHVGLGAPAYNLLIHTAPFRKGDEVSSIEDEYHWHVEIIPRVGHFAGFEWATGFYLCPIPPEDAARYLREVAV